MRGQIPVGYVLVAVLGAVLLGRVLAYSAPLPGDAPDAQVFATFRSPAGGYELQVPQGWARTTQGSEVRFTSAPEGVGVVVRPAAAAPTEAIAPTAVTVAASAQTGRAMHITNVRDVRLPGGAAVLVEYTSTSAPDAVTGKSVHLRSDAYLFFKRGAVAIVTLWAPVGTTNVDEWQYMARSFRWR